jgi:aspartyl-tRNA(Asn)/glutamyl-tRNA(Gln) amidotransferase subunit C
MTLTLDEVRHIAHLARLSLTPEEEQRFQQQLSSILEHASRLSEVDTTGIPPTASVLPLQARLRADSPRPASSQPRILANAPDAAGDCFRIPPVFDGEP